MFIYFYCNIIRSGITPSVVKIGRHIIKEFEIQKGLRQGDAIAPILFNVALEIAIRKSGIQMEGTTFIYINL